METGQARCPSPEFETSKGVGSSSPPWPPREWWIWGRSTQCHPFTGVFSVPKKLQLYPISWGRIQLDCWANKKWGGILSWGKSPIKNVGCLRAHVCPRRHKCASNSLEKNMSLHENSKPIFTCCKNLIYTPWNLFLCRLNQVYVPGEILNPQGTLKGAKLSQIYMQKCSFCSSGCLGKTMRGNVGLILLPSSSFGEIKGKKKTKKICVSFCLKKLQKESKWWMPTRFLHSPRPNYLELKKQPHFSEIVWRYLGRGGGLCNGRQTGWTKQDGWASYVFLGTLPALSEAYTEYVVSSELCKTLIINQEGNGGEPSAFHPIQWLS